MHYFRAQPESPDRDRCFIIKGSIAGLLDQPGSWQYSTSKFGLRGLYRSMRHTTWQEGIRVNYVGPWYTKTSIMSDAVIERLSSKGVEFSLTGDCAAAMLKIATDKEINGSYINSYSCLSNLLICGTGHSFAIVPRSGCARGWFDNGLDEVEEGSYWDKMQKAALAASVRAVRSQ
jgi:short chain dehydrogenase